MVFAALGFQVQFEPHGRKGPDLGISRDGRQAVVEVTRFRTVHPGPPVLDLDDSNLELPSYGDIARDTRKAIDKLMGKFEQVSGAPGIIAIWNDDEDLEELEVEMAVEGLRSEPVDGAGRPPSGLLFVVYASKWRRAGDHKQIWCFPARDPEDAFWCRCQEELSQATMPDLVRRACAQTAPASS